MFPIIHGCMPKKENADIHSEPPRSEKSLTPFSTKSFSVSWNINGQ